MPIFVDWSNLAESLWGSPGIREHIKSIYQLPEHVEDRTSFLRALNLAFRYHQPAPADPFSICLSNQEVFKAAVWAIGSNMREWNLFLKKEPELSSVLCNYDITAVARASHSPDYISCIGAILGGQTGSKDARAIVDWAKVLNGFGPSNSKSYYSRQIQPLAKTVYNSLKIFHHSLWQAGRVKTSKGFVLNCDPHYAAEITAICLVAIFSNPLKKWKKQGVKEWKGMGFALGMEFIRNLGWPGFKPDRHVIRLFNSWGLKNTYKTMIERSPAIHFIKSVVGRRKLSHEIFYALLGLTVSPPPSVMPPSFSDNLTWLLGSEVERKGNRSKAKSVYTMKETALPHPFYRTKVKDCSGDGKWHIWEEAIRNGIFRDMSAWVANSFSPLGKERVWSKLASLDAVLLMPIDIFRKAVEQGGVEPVQMPGPEIGYEPWWQGCEEPPEPNTQFPDDWEEELWPRPTKNGEEDNPEIADVPETVEVPIDREPIPWPGGEEAKRGGAGEEKEDIQPEKRRPFGPPDMEVGPLEDESILSEGPYHGVGQGAQKLIIEPYGMYVPSLRQWAKKLPKGGYEWKCIHTFIEQNPCNSGPAILLFPEAISTIPRKLERVIYAQKLSRDKIMPDGCTATMSGLRMIFFHEVGHHIFSDFQYGKSPAKEVYHEALASWLAHKLLAPWEQKLLKELSYTQAPIYRAYLGLVFMENGVGMEKPFSLLVNHAYAGTFGSAAHAIGSHLRRLGPHFHNIGTSTAVSTELAMAFRLVSLL